MVILKTYNKKMLKAGRYLIVKKAAAERSSKGYFTFHENEPSLEGQYTGTNIVCNVGDKALITNVYKTEEGGVVLEFELNGVKATSYLMWLKQYFSLEIPHGENLIVGEPKLNKVNSHNVFKPINQ